MNIKGALHLHSAYSYDAKLSLRELRSLFMQEGLSFALMTEHTDEMRTEEGERFIAECRALSDEHFVLVPGFEVPYKDTHTLMIGSTAFSDKREKEALEAFKAHAALAVLAHPHKHGYTADGTLLKVIDGLEVWNSQYDGKYVPRKKSLKLFHALNRQKPLYAFAGWDLHRSEHAGGPTLMLDVRELSEAAILEQLKQGNFVIKGRGATVNAQGYFQRGGGWGARLTGSFSIFLVTLGKKVNAALARFGVRAPRALRRAVRRFL